jgi:hypothetical protein
MMEDELGSIQQNSTGALSSQNWDFGTDAGDATV